MFTNISLLYTGTAAEAGAVALTASVARGLRAAAECQYVADPLSVLTRDQLARYRAVLEMSGFEAAERFFGTSYRERLTEAAAAAEAAFRAVPEREGVTWAGTLELVQQPDTTLSTLGYTHDMTAVGFGLAPSVFDRALDQVLLRAGAPVMLVAHAPRAPRLEDMTLVYAWKPSAPSKRALRNSLPLLRAAKRVHLVAIEEDDVPPMIPSVQHMADYLMNVHSVASEPVLLRADNRPPAQLARFYDEMQADLLVMGAYSQSRLKQLLFGGFTKYFLDGRCCNLLLAH